MSITKKQHIIPASYIAGFSNLPKKNLRKSELWFWKKDVDKPFLKSAQKRLYEDNYFEIDTDFFGQDFSLYWLEEIDIVNFVENQQQDIEWEFLRIKEILINNQTSLSQEDSQWLIYYAVHLHMRTIRKRREICEIYSSEIDKKYADSSNIWFRKMGLVTQWLNPDRLDEFLSIRWIEVVWNTMSVKSVLGYKTPDVFYQAEMNRFSEYTFDFYRTTNNEEFISGDHPVVIWKRCIIFPLDRNICLVWVKQNTPLTLDLINRSIASNAEKVIFGSSHDLIVKYKVYLDIKDTFVRRHLDEELDSKALQEEYTRWLFNLLIEKFL